MEDESFVFSGVIRGHHVYKLVWSSIVGEMVELIPESGNEHDRYAVKMMKDDETVGHAPKEISKIFYYFLQHNGRINAEVTGHRGYGKGLEVPFKYILAGKPRYILQAKKILSKKLKLNTN